MGDWMMFKDILRGKIPLWAPARIRSLSAAAEAEAVSRRRAQAGL